MGMQYERSQRGSAYENRRSSQNGNMERLATGLGWFSIGLGLAEAIAPGGVARLIGANDTGKTRTLLRTYGFREIAAGVGILMQARPTPWLWGRVAGDMLDLASLGVGLASDATDRTKLSVATAAVAGVTALDIYCGKQLSSEASASTSNKGMVEAEGSVIVDRSPEELYRYWSDFANFPKFVSRVESVQDQGGGRSHWTAKVAGMSIEWESQTIFDEANHRIAWHSLEGSTMDNYGSVRFERAPGGRGTMVQAHMKYSLPGGAVTSGIAKLFGADPEQELNKTLRAFKAIMETGEVIKSDASIHAGMHAAQPPEQAQPLPSAEGGRERAETLAPSIV
jgi:uncharacterized membrane protein